MLTQIRNVADKEHTPTELEAHRNDAQAQLLKWHQESSELAFVYSRSLGGLIQTGRCRIVRLSQEAVTLDATGCKLVIALSGARYELGPQQFFTPDLLSAFDVTGVAVHLANHDWLFVSADAKPNQALDLSRSS